MAEGLFKDAAAVAGVEMEIASAGIAAVVDWPADPLAVDLMEERNIDITPHRARQIDTDMVAESDLVLVMEKWQQRELEIKYPFSRGRVRVIGEWSGSEVADPVGKKRPAFEAALRAIEQGVSEWMARFGDENIDSD